MRSIKVKKSKLHCKYYIKREKNIKKKKKKKKSK